MARAARTDAPTRRAPRPAPLLVLASASPRRARILAELGLRFLAVPAKHDETGPPSSSPADLARALAEAKASAVAPRAPAGAFVLAADTTVDLDGRAIGKPADAAEARVTLAALSARSHLVHTGIAVRDPSGRMRSTAVTTRVEFAPLSERQIERYVATGEPLDKAGAYGIQTVPSAWVRRVDGDYHNVVGLPIEATLRLLRDAGFALPPHLKGS